MSSSSKTPLALPAVHRGFNITARIGAICADMVQRTPELQHIDVTRIVFSFAQTRKAVPYGRQASLTPLRFEGGSRWRWLQGRRVAVQRLLMPDGREALYLLTVYLPRFMNLNFHEKLVTLFHELWHIHPDFNGDIRRHAGRCYAHSHSRDQYDAAMRQLADRWLAAPPPEPLYDFLRLDFNELQRRNGPIIGTRTRRPRLVPAPEA